MARKPTKAPAKRRASAKAPPAPRIPKRTPAERKSKAIELCLHAIAGGWTLVRFARISGVSKSSLMRWMAEDTVQPRYLRAMQVKALALPDEAMDLVHRLVDGKRVIRPVEGKPGEFETVTLFGDPKALGVALRHYEFRMMREIKALYQPSREITTTSQVADLPDEQIDRRIAELLELQQAERAARGKAPGD